MTKQIAKFDSKVSSKAFIEKVKDQYVERYADHMVRILEDQKKLQRALDKINKIVAEVETGNYEAIDRYFKARSVLEVAEDAEF